MRLRALAAPPPLASSSSRRRVLLLSIVTMTLVSLAVAVVVLGALYTAALEEERARLTEVVQSRARIIEAVARHEVEAHAGGANAREAARTATLRQIVESHENFKGFGETGEFQLARREGSRIFFLLRQRHGARETPRSIPFDSEQGEPMRRALRGESGVVVSVDYRGAPVLAAYDSVVDLGWGVVAKIDLAEIRTPFLRAGLLAGTIALLISGTGTWLVARVMARLLRSVEERTRLLQEEIREREQAQEALRQSEEQLREAQKLEAIGHLASGIAHDFNNLITVILASSEALRGHVEAKSRGQAEIDQIQRASDQARDVTRSLLTFSRNVPLERRAVRLQTLLDESSGLLRHLLPAGVDLLVDRPDQPGIWVEGDPTQLQQVLLNLGINARDAMPDGGTLRISAVAAPGLEPAESAAAPDIPPGFARVTLSDTGLGIPEEHRSRIFEPFFTTKERGQGTGLGLSIAHGIVTEHGGRIQVSSEPGEGTSLSIYLPCVSPPSGPRQEPPDRRASTGRGELILLAEGHDQVRAALASALESLGYEVEQAANGDRFLELFNEHGTEAELLVLDIDMPRRGGLACLAEVRQADAGIPAVLITGNPVDCFDEWRERTDVLLRKPFPMSEFGEIVTSLLEQRQPLEGVP